MSKQMNCSHFFVACKKQNDLSFCGNCGIMKIKKEIMKKPKQYEKKIEIDPFEVFNKVAEKSTKFKINYGNTMHLEYLERRKNIINTIESFCILQNADQETFYQAVLYLDKIIFQEKLSEYIEKITKEYFENNLNKETNFFAKFIKKEIRQFNTIDNNYGFNKLVFRNVIEFDYLFVSLAIGCFIISNKYIEKIPRLFDENKLHSLQLNYRFYNRDLHYSELLCLELLDYQLSDLSSFSVLKMILENGIALESDKNANLHFDSMLEKLYDNILVMNSMFLVDKRFVDFNALEIAISLITYNAELFALDSWKRIVGSFYTRKHKVSSCTCLVVVRSLFSIDNKHLDPKSKLANEEKTIKKFNNCNRNNYNNNQSSKNNDNSNYSEYYKFPQKRVTQEKANINIDYEYYLKLKDTYSFKNQMNRESLYLAEFDCRHFSNNLNLNLPNFTYNYNNNLFNNAIDNKYNKKPLGENTYFHMQDSESLYNHSNFQGSKQINGKLFNCDDSNLNLNSFSNTNVSFNKNKNYNFSAKGLYLNNTRKFKEDVLLTNPINNKLNQNNNLKINNNDDCNFHNNCNYLSNNFNSYSNYFFSNMNQLNAKQENLKCQDTTFDQNRNKNNFSSLLSNYYNGNNTANNFIWNTCKNEINSNDVSEKNHLNNNNQITCSKYRNDCYIHNSVSSPKEILLNQNPNKIKEANKDVITSINSAKNSANDYLENSEKKDYKDSSDSTKIEESPVNETTVSSICLREKSDSRMFNFFNSVNRKLLESEAINQSGKKSEK